MNALIVYDSIHGNTEQVARAIAETLASEHRAQVIRAADARANDTARVELLLVGGPTQRRHASPALQRFLDGLPRRTLSHVSAATFDTRYRMSRFLSGSAALEADRHLRRAGAQMIAEPESFFIQRDVPPSGQKRRHDVEQLEDGELERARLWAARLLPVQLSKAG